MFKTICYENKLFFQRIMGSVKTMTLQPVWILMGVARREEKTKKETIFRLYNL